MSLAANMVSGGGVIGGSGNGSQLGSVVGKMIGGGSGNMMNGSMNPSGNASPTNAQLFIPQEMKLNDTQTKKGPIP